MNVRLILAVTAGFLIAVLTAGCGSGNRQLESLSINPASATGQNGQAQFTATAQFNQAPSPVTPASVVWFQDGVGFDPPGDTLSFTLTSQPFIAHCFMSASTITVTAFAPISTDASSGNIPLQVFLDLTLRQKTNQEAGFLAVSAQMTCP